MAEPLDHVTHIVADSSRFAGAIPDDLSSPVPTCPGWDSQALVEHLGEVQRFWAHVLGLGGQQPSDVDIPDAPADRPGLLEWFGESTAELVAALGRVAPTDPAWTWWGEPATAGAIARHQVQEAAVHRVDAELVEGTATPLHVDVANDGVAEFLQVMLDVPKGTVLRPVRLRATDTGSEWRTGGDGPGPETAAAAVTVSGTASDLVLVLYGRLGLDALTVDGDREAAEALLTSTSTE
jgi:uncharacterized protein (TIGR03083 family)